jgi:spoIIIJ-associated protein
MNQTPREILETMLGHLGFVVEIEEELRNGLLILQVRTREPSLLIGRRDETLESLQCLLNRILMARNANAPHVIVDVEFHRSMRDDEFLRRMRLLGSAVLEHGRPVETEPLNAYDRRLVHQAFKDDPGLQTWSPPGDEKIKRVTIRKRD